MHVGTNHWATAILAFNHDGKGQMFSADSLHRRGIHPDTQKLAQQVWPQLTVQPLKVQQQRGGMDCGLFAIAFAEAAARGKELEDLRFRQEGMRAHLVACFRQGQLTPFPGQ